MKITIVCVFLIVCSCIEASAGSNVLEDWGGARQQTDSPVKAESNKPGIVHHHTHGTGAPKSRHHGHISKGKSAGGSKKHGKEAHTDAALSVIPGATPSGAPEGTTA